MANIRSKTCKKVLLIMLLTTMLANQVIVASAAKSDTDNFTAGNKIFNTTADVKADIPTAENPGGVPGFGYVGADGRIWVDKAVTDKEDGSFDVNLSALTQEFTSSKTGVSTSSTAADVVFVLDGSASMGIQGVSNDIEDGSGNKLYRLEAMIKATNEAIDIILKANPKNRIAVNWYCGSGGTGDIGKSETILELDTYSIDAGTKGYLEWSGDSFTPKNKLFYSRTLKDSAGVKLDNGKDMFGARNGFEAFGGTPTQKGIASALNQAIEDIEASGDIGERKPYVFLLSDGGASLGNPKWYEETSVINDNETIGNGNEELVGPSSARPLDQITANLILTSAYMKDKLNAAYNAYNTDKGHTPSDAKLYTVGLGSDINGPFVDNVSKADIKYAWCGLEPLAIEKAIKGEPYWSPDQVWDPAQVTAATNVKRLINEYVDAAVAAGRADLEKYKEEKHYNYSGYYNYADNYENLKKAFAQLAEDIYADTKVVQSPIETDPTTDSSAIYFEDVIGKGMDIGDKLFLNVSGQPSIEGALTEDTATSKVYTFAGYGTKANVITNADGSKTVKWFIQSADLKHCTYKINTDGTYGASEPLSLSYNLKLNSEVKAEEGTTYYTNAFETDAANKKVAGTSATFRPNMDNPYYFYTNEKVGIIGTLNNVGFDTDTEISHFVKGTKIDGADTLASLEKVYVTTNMATAKESPYSISEVGLVVDKLKVAESGTYSTEFETAVKDSIKDCAVATDMAGDTYAFQAGIQQEHDHVVEKAANANKTETATYLSDESFIDGQIKMLLGNNGRANITHNISKTTSNPIVIKGDTVTYEIVVNNYTDNDATGLTITDDMPAGLTDITNATHTGVTATYALAGNKVSWTNVAIPKKSSVTLSVTAKVPADTTSTEYLNEAKIVVVGGTALTTPSVSNQVKNEVKDGIKIQVKKDDTSWNDHGKTFKLKATDGTVYEMTDNMPNGTYTIMDGTTETYQTIVIADKSGSAVIDYYTLTINYDTGVASTSGAGVYLKGTTVHVSATIKGTHEFEKWAGTVAGSPNTNANTVTMTGAITISASTTEKVLPSTGAKIDIKLEKDGAPWNDYTNTIVVKNALGNTVADLDNVPEGTYSIYDGDVSTGQTITVTADDVTNQTKKEATLEYFTVTLNKGEGIKDTIGAGIYLEGTKVSINASLMEGYKFSSWDGSQTYKEAAQTIEINQKLVFTATAAKMESNESTPIPPKTPTPPKTPVKTPPKTGDDMGRLVGLYGVLITISALSIISIFTRKKLKK